MDFKVLFWALFGLTLLIFIANGVFTPIIRKKASQKAEKKQDEAMSKIKKGDTVMLVSGVFGVVTKTHKRDVLLDISQNEKTPMIIKVDKQGIMGYFNNNKKTKK